MITDHTYFTNRTYETLLKIEEEMNNSIEISKFKFSKFTREEIYPEYCQIFLSFPYDVIASNKSVGISINAVELIAEGYSFEEHSEKKKVNQDDIEMHLANRKTFNPTHCFETVQNFIDEYFNRLFFKYDLFLESSKKIPFFAAIDDEKVILLNLLKLYYSTLKNDSIQIDLFRTLHLPKILNDEILKVIIEFIENRLNILNIQMTDIQHTSKNKTSRDWDHKVVWNGTQQQLCELFIKLEESGWIEAFETIKKKQYINSICKLFDISKTKRNSRSDEVNSFYQTFKGEIIEGQKTYPFLERPNYRKVIEKINENK